ncbi:MAG: LacI family transcriptional regulator [Bacteroidales bacterium]|nr:LacI family transcriptional regulator [Bacteroidales bacterium]
MKKITLSSIAEKTGFSTATVSRVLGGRAQECRIPESTVKIILKEARRSKYSPKLIARTIKTHKSELIGLLLPSVSNPFFAELASHVISSIQKTPYTTVIMDTMENSHICRDNVSTLVSKGVDGIIAVPCGNGEDEQIFLESIDRNYCPVVMLDRFFLNTSLPYVTVDNYIGGRMAVERLINAGHSKIACIQGKSSSLPNIERVRGYRDAMSDNGLVKFIEIEGNEFSIDNGYMSMKKLISSKNRPTAIFANSNTILQGTLKAMEEHGLEIGRDISIVSFDNVYSFRTSERKIAHINQPMADMAAIAVRILISRLKGGKKVTSQIKLAPTLVEGDSVN